MLGYLSLEIICSSKLTVFLELLPRKTIRFSEQITSADKYPSIFSRQMKAIVYIFVYCNRFGCYLCSADLSWIMKLLMLNILFERDLLLVLMLWCLFSSQSSLEAVLRYIRSLMSHAHNLLKSQRTMGFWAMGDCTYLWKAHLTSYLHFPAGSGQQLTYKEL